VKGKAFTRARGLTWANVDWHAAGEVHATHRAVTMHLMSVKDPHGRGQRVPIPIRQRAAPTPTTKRRKGGKGVRLPASPDPLCAYSLLEQAWLEDVERLGLAAALLAPIFRRGPAAAAEAFDTGDVLDVVRDVVAAAGETRLREFGAHSARIGGATDFRDLLGRKKSKAVLKGRGRWKGDIAYIYQRAGMAESLDASGDVGDVRTQDIESIFAGYTQPSA
jgi:hypothetical protein